MRCKEASLSKTGTQREVANEHDAAGGRPAKSFIFGSRTADAQTEVYGDGASEQVIKRFSDADTLSKALSFVHAGALTYMHLLYLFFSWH